MSTYRRHDTVNASTISACCKFSDFALLVSEASELLDQTGYADATGALDVMQHVRASIDERTRQRTAAAQTAAPERRALVLRRQGAEPPLLAHIPLVKVAGGSSRRAAVGTLSPDAALRAVLERLHLGLGECLGQADGTAPSADDGGTALVWTILHEHQYHLLMDDRKKQGASSGSRRNDMRAFVTGRAETLRHLSRQARKVEATVERSAGKSRKLREAARAPVGSGGPSSPLSANVGKMFDEASVAGLLRDIARALSKRSIGVRGFYREMDVDRDGTLTLSELSLALESLGVKMDNSAEKALWQHLDQDQSGNIGPDELHNALLAGAPDVYSATDEQPAPATDAGPSSPDSGAPWSFERRPTGMAPPTAAGIQAYERLNRKERELAERLIADHIVASRNQAVEVYMRARQAYLSQHAESRRHDAAVARRAADAESVRQRTRQTFRSERGRTNDVLKRQQSRARERARQRNVRGALEHDAAAPGCVGPAGFGGTELAQGALRAVWGGDDREVREAAMLAAFHAWTADVKPARKNAEALSRDYCARVLSRGGGVDVDEEAAIETERKEVAARIFQRVWRGHTFRSYVWALRYFQDVHHIWQLFSRCCPDPMRPLELRRLQDAACGCLDDADLVDRWHNHSKPVPEEQRQISLRAMGKLLDELGLPWPSGRRDRAVAGLERECMELVTVLEQPAAAAAAAAGNEGEGEGEGGAGNEALTDHLNLVKRECISWPRFHLWWLTFLPVSTTWTGMLKLVRCAERQWRSEAAAKAKQPQVLSKASAQSKRHRRGSIVRSASEVAFAVEEARNAAKKSVHQTFAQHGSVAAPSDPLGAAAGGAAAARKAALERQVSTHQLNAVIEAAPEALSNAKKLRVVAFGGAMFPDGTRREAPVREAKSRFYRRVVQALKAGLRMRRMASAGAGTGHRAATQKSLSNPEAYLDTEHLFRTLNVSHSDGIKLIQPTTGVRAPPGSLRAKTAAWGADRYQVEEVGKARRKAQRRAARHADAASTASTLPPPPLAPPSPGQLASGSSRARLGFDTPPRRTGRRRRRKKAAIVPSPVAAPNSLHEWKWQNR